MPSLPPRQRVPAPTAATALPPLERRASALGSTPVSPASSTQAAAQHATALTRSGLLAIVAFLPNGAATAAGAASGDTASPHTRHHRGPTDSAPTEPGVYADGLFAQASQPPSAVRAAASAGAVTQLSLPSSLPLPEGITRPLALLAASPGCRRAMEECLLSGCVLAPRRVLTLQVCHRDPRDTSPAGYSLLSAAHVDSTVQRSSRRRRGHRKGQAAVPPPDALRASRVVAEAVQQLVVTSVNAPARGPSLPLLAPRAPSQSPARPSRPVSASPRVGGLSPRQVLTASPLPPAPSTLLLPAADTAGATAAASTTATAAQGPLQTQPRRCSLPPVDSPSVSSRSPVLLSRRVPVVPATAAVRASAPASLASPPTAPTPPAPAAATPPLSPSSPFRAVPAVARVVSATTQRGGSGGQEDSAVSSSPPSTPSLRPTQFPSLSPRQLPASPPVRAATATVAVPAGQSPTSCPPSPPLAGTSGAGAARGEGSTGPPLPPSEAVRALSVALWWVRRGPLPVSLRLLHYSAEDLHALWALLRGEAEEEHDTGRAAAACCDSPPQGQLPTATVPLAHTHSRADGHAAVAALPALSSPSPSPTNHTRGGVEPRQQPSAASTIGLRSPVAEVHVHGRAADTAIAALLSSHPEVRALRLTHGAVTDAQLRDLARSCPDVTQLSLAMNRELQSTSFLCPTPSEASSVATTVATTVNTNAYTAAPPAPASSSTSAAAAAAAVSLPPPSSLHGSSSGPRSPRTSATATRRALPPALAEEAPRAAAALALPLASPHKERRGGPPQPPPCSPRRRSSAQPALLGASFPGPAAPLSFVPEAEDRGATREARDALPDSARGYAASLASDTPGGTANSRSTQPPPPQAPPQPSPSLQRHHVLSPRQSSCDALQSSQLDLFAAEEDGEAEMRLSLWQAAQTDAAERRQAVFILRPSDVTLGGSGAELAAAAARPNAGPQDERTDGASSAEASFIAQTATAPKASDNLGEGAEENGPPAAAAAGLGSLHAAEAAAAPHAPPASVSTASQYTDPAHTAVSPATALLRDALESIKQGVGLWSTQPTVAAEVNASETAEAAVARAPCSSRDEGHADRHRRGRPRAATHWADTLMDLDLSYTHVPDDDAARDVPRLRALRRLSLEGCLQLTQIRWVPAVASLRELNLSFSSLEGSSLHPLGGCAHLVWLKLEGCGTFTRVDQLWLPESEGDGTANCPDTAPSSPPLLRSLRTLIATGTGLTDEGLLPLAQLESLECLLLDRCSALSSVNVAAQLPSLHTLDASRTAVTVDGVAALRHSRTLQQLRLQECLGLTRLPAFFVEAGGRASGQTEEQTRRDARVTSAALRVLDVSECANLVAGGVESMVADAVFIYLRDAAVGGDAGEAGSDGVQLSASSLPQVHGEFRQLRHLLLRSCNAVSRLGCLAAFPYVVELDLYHTDVDDATLTAALQRWTCLEVLNLASTRVTSLAAWWPVAQQHSEGEGESDGEEEGERGVEQVHAGREAKALEDARTSDNGRREAEGKEGSAKRQGLLASALSCVPPFASTLRTLLLSNTEVTADGLAVLRFFARLETLQLANCRRITSLRFLAVSSLSLDDGGCGGDDGALHRRTALRELAVTEASELCNEAALPFLALCPNLRSLSLVGCTRLGGGAQAAPVTSLPLPPPFASAPLAAPRPFLSLSPASSAQSALSAATSATGGGASDLGVLGGMGGLVDLNLSRTAVTQAEMRVVLRGRAAGSTATGTVMSSVARASARLNLLATPEPATAATAPSSTRMEGSAGAETKTGPRLAKQPASFVCTSLQRVWLRGCRYLNEGDLLDAAMAAMSSEASIVGDGVDAGGWHHQQQQQRARVAQALASVREVYLSHGRYDSRVLYGLLS